MKREIVYSLDSLYRGSFDIEAFTFGEGTPAETDKSIAIVGALRGNELQQLYIASKLVNSLMRLESQGLISKDAWIRVLPSGNPFSLNTRSRFWAVDNTDINRMFPGYDKGETTQRIAAGIFDSVKESAYGVHLASMYLPGEFVPHARVMNTQGADLDIATRFGLPYAIIREPEPIDSGSLSYNWQIWGTRAASLYSRSTSTIDARAAQQIVFAMLRFMTSIGAIRYDLHGGFVTTVVKENHLVSVTAPCGGILEERVSVGDHVEAGESIATIHDPLTGELRCNLAAPTNGVVFFSHANYLAAEDSIIFRIIDDRVIED